MINLVLIAALSENNVIGNKGKIPWHLPLDLKHFRDLTIGHPVIMGRNTFDSLPKKPLPNRRNIVLSRSDLSYPGIIFSKSFDEAISLCEDVETVYVIGGQRVYEESLPFANRMELTRVYGKFEGDCFFPDVNFDEWSLLRREENLNCCFLSYSRKS
jgi:dihydrofolate reductase